MMRFRSIFWYDFFDIANVAYSFLKSWLEIMAQNPSYYTLHHLPWDLPSLGYKKLGGDILP
jgi:hypothetical protein